jgi:hypothetical protein
MHKNLDYFSQETPYLSATENKQLLLFREDIDAYCENHTKNTNTLSGHIAQLWYVKAGGTYSNHWSLKN